MMPLARTTVFDTQLIASVSTPMPAMLRTSVTTTMLHGEPAAPVLVTACNRPAAAMPGADLVVVPESHNHDVNPTGTVREVLARVG